MVGILNEVKGMDSASAKDYENLGRPKRNRNPNPRYLSDLPLKLDIQNENKKNKIKIIRTKPNDQNANPTVRKSKSNKRVKSKIESTRMDNAKEQTNYLKTDQNHNRFDRKNKKNTKWQKDDNDNCFLDSNESSPIQSQNISNQHTFICNQREVDNFKPKSYSSHRNTQDKKELSYIKSKKSQKGSSSVLDENLQHKAKSNCSSSSRKYKRNDEKLSKCEDFLLAANDSSISVEATQTTMNEFQLSNDDRTFTQSQENQNLHSFDNNQLEENIESSTPKSYKHHSNTQNEDDLNFATSNNSYGLVDQSGFINDISFIDNSMVEPLDFSIPN